MATNPAKIAGLAGLESIVERQAGPNWGSTAVLFTKSALQLYFYGSGRALIRQGHPCQLPIPESTPRQSEPLFETPAGEGRFEVMSVRHDKLLFFGLIGLVTLLFFLHVPNGGFQARNGPTTPVNNLRAALVGLLLLLAAGTTSVFIDSSSNSMLGHISSVFLHSPAACSIGISLRC